MKWAGISGALAGTARERLGRGAVVIGVIVGSGLIVSGSCRKDRSALGTVTVFPAKPIRGAERRPVVAPESPRTDTIVVYVTGAVKRPGVYTLPAHARLYHAIRAAGGFKANAVTEALNLADQARDGDQLCVPVRQKVVPAAPASRSETARGGTHPIEWYARRAPASYPNIIRKAALPASVTLPPLPEGGVGPEESGEPIVTVIATPTPAPGRVLDGTLQAVTEASNTEPRVASEGANVGVGLPPSARPSVALTGVIPLPTTGRRGARGMSRASAPRGGVKFKNPGDGVVHINSAGASELEHLPRCGPAMSAKILAYRAQIGRFTDLNQLMDVKGCGEKTFEKWQPFLAL